MFRDLDIGRAVWKLLFRSVDTFSYSDESMVFFASSLSLGLIDDDVQIKFSFVQLVEIVICFFDNVCYR